MNFDEFIKMKVALGELRPATEEELKDHPDCMHNWHKNPESIRCGTCPACGQRMKGWLYPA